MTAAGQLALDLAPARRKLPPPATAPTLSLARRDTGTLHRIGPVACWLCDAEPGKPCVPSCMTWTIDTPGGPTPLEVVARVRELAARRAS